MFGLIGCRNFRASCERIVSSWPQKDTLSVFSENSPPLFQRIERLRGGSSEGRNPYGKSGLAFREVAPLSRSDSDHLYARLSSRLMTALSSFVLDVDIRAPDSAFLSFSGFDRYDLRRCGNRIVHNAELATGLPLYLGIGATRTLAWIAGLFAERYPGYRGVCVIDTREKREKALRLTPITLILGNEERKVSKLASKGVETAYDFSLLPQDWVRKNMDSTDLETWRELNGRSSNLKTDTLPDERISACRSFDTPVEDAGELDKAVTACMSECVRRLRVRKQGVLSLLVFTGTERAAGDLSQTYETRLISFPQATDDLALIRQRVGDVVASLYMRGNRYTKTGVVVIESVEQTVTQMTLFPMLDGEGFRTSDTGTAGPDKTNRAKDGFVPKTPKRGKKRKNDRFLHGTADKTSVVNCG